MKVVAAATPLPLVVTVPGAKVPPAPLPGPLKATVVPETSTGLPCASSTVTTSGLPKADPTEVLWPFPPVTTAWKAVPALLVSEKAAEVKPADVAVTV